MSDSYWNQRLLSRRAALRAAAVAGGGVVALSLVGCGGGDDDGNKAAAPTATGAASATLDSTKGKPGGKLVIQPTGYGTTLVLVTTNNNSTAGLAGFTHSGLYGLKAGRPIVAGNEITSEPDLAQAMPEQPDQTSYVVKLKPAKFHSGRAVTSQDVKYSYERYANGADSAYKSSWVWLDKVETPDPQTAVIKTKQPYADTVGAMSAYFDSFIMAQEWEEGPDAKTKLMGSGPFLFVDTTAPVQTRYKKNPDFFDKPYPYFDEIQMLGNADFTKRFADFSARNVDVTYRHPAEESDQIKKSRPDAKAFEWQYYGFYVIMRTDQAPFTDERVRQALSMAIDRKVLRDATAKGQGEDDQAFSWVVKNLGFRKPSELGDAAKYWKLDVQSAKQLLTAAGITTPIKTKMAHWDPTVIGQAYVDQATLVQAHWRQNLGIEVEDVAQAFAPLSTGAGAGNYDGTFFYPGGGGTTIPSAGLAMRNSVFSPPAGVVPPTPNQGHINDPELSAAADKQATQLNLAERKASFRTMEEIMAKKQYRLVTSTYPGTYFVNPKLANAQVPITAVNGSMGWTKYWWFET